MAYGGGRFWRYVRHSALASLLCLPLIALSADVLRVLAWPGYADPDVVAAFEKRHGVRVEISFIDSDDALWKRIAPDEGASFDVFAVNTAELQRYLARNLVAPIDLDAVPARARQLPAFRDLDALPGVMWRGRPHAVPYAWSAMGLIYDRKQVTESPDSIAALWDERWRGKVLAYNGGSHNFVLAAQVLDVPDPFALQEGDWASAAASLIDLRRNVLSFYTLPDDSVERFMRHGAALMFANYGTQQLHMLREAGADVDYVLPREGALAWLDCWVVTRATQQPALAHAWIEHMLGEQASDALTTRHGLANTVMHAEEAADEARLLWLRPVEDAERRTLMWRKIVSGDRLQRVLQP